MLASPLATAELRYVDNHLMVILPSQVMMLSAWNEHDEGHWIEPALDKYGGAEKLEAIKRAIDTAMQRNTQL